MQPYTGLRYLAIMLDILGEERSLCFLESFQTDSWNYLYPNWNWGDAWVYIIEPFLTAAVAWNNYGGIPEYDQK